ncbi:carboxylate-amine ligase [Labedaea rhizosphaerae]|uniref:Putative glutamate--cysteine ligase 2 n=1 Tax=Labedaea rhizosphaerae TaxID=598644 RepID=A0A4R6S3B2_LABRH|nr:glutamate--cysteine ligase [Labedaea rhizosphaerae]TDP94110.1 carboxylate-amine ligase [Labedaea rhizosphaerae]
MDADTAQGRTFGVEEEFVLVDAETARTRAVGPAVLATASMSPPGAADATLQAELADAQVEAATGRCTDTGALAEQLRHARQRLAAAAAEHDTLLLSTGSPLWVGDQVSADEARGARFNRVVTTYVECARDYQVCGCHVHVGVPDRDTAVAVVNHVRPWLPTLLALSANSPTHLGHDSGFASWRMIMQSRFPGSGVPPWFDSAEDFDAQVARLVDCGVLVDDRQSFWLARPSPWLPTVEFRVADAVLDVGEAVLQAALSRALVRTALRELVAGRPGPPVDDQVAAAAVWSAARHGLAGAGIDVHVAKQVPATDLLNRLLDWTRPALTELGDLALVEAGLQAVLTHGTGAERQRRALADGPDALIRMLADRTVERKAKP